MRILGIDPGLAIVGFGVLDSGKGGPAHIRHGVIRTPAGETLERRLLTVYEDFTELVETFAPDALAIEELYFKKNVNTGLPVAHSRGVILMAAARRGLTVAEYSPQQVKLAVTGYGNAEKKQVMEMTRSLLRLSKLPRPDDAADALAVAICHAYTAGSVLGKLV
ncbi:MAG: crossover junction endodeoxyribonuclease RuvC [Oscillospiraceae bacterium]|jgi:crossover junction endodeoxyribonuclease RuvC|nr:crossover junction endodeoxyribonuclease RuvC [Oscillospiraceae bacterium]